MKNVLKSFIILVGAVLLTLVLVGAAGSIYFIVFPKESAGSFVGSKDVVGIPLAYIFSLIVLFTSFGGTKKYWWIGAALIPAIIFEVAFDLQHIYFPVAIGLVGWLLGKGLSMLIAKHKL